MFVLQHVGDKKTVPMFISNDKTKLEQKIDELTTSAKEYHEQCKKVKKKYSEELMDFLVKNKHAIPSWLRDDVESVYRGILYGGLLNHFVILDKVKDPIPKCEEIPVPKIFYDAEDFRIDKVEVI
jgi:gas vesicle protein